MPDDVTVTTDNTVEGQPAAQPSGEEKAPEGAATPAVPAVPAKGASPPEEKPNYDAQTLAELTANAQATEAMFLAGLQALDSQINVGHPEIEDVAVRKAAELAEREQRLGAREQLSEFRARSAVLVEAYKKTGLPVATLINLAKGASSAADFQAQVASLTPASKPASTVAPTPTAQAATPASPVDSGMNQGAPPKKEVWRDLDPADKIMYAFQHSK